MIYWFLLTAIVFIVVLSWTDLQSHVGYAFVVSVFEGWWKFPVIWLHSFLIPIAFLKSGKSALDFDILSNLERALRLGLSDDPSVKCSFDTRRDQYVIEGVDSRTVYFKIPPNESVEINGYDKLIPPRLAFCMLALAKKIDKQSSNKNKEPKSLLS